MKIIKYILGLGVLSLGFAVNAKPNLVWSLVNKGDEPVTVFVHGVRMVIEPGYEASAPMTSGHTTFSVYDESKPVDYDPEWRIHVAGGWD